MKSRPRAVLCVNDPWNYIPQLQDYSLMILNPASPPARINYLLDNSDYSLLITEKDQQHRDGRLYDEKVFWYTSGTTGDSKFYSFTDQQVDLLAEKICKSYKITSDDRYVGIMPLWHAHGQGFYWATRRAGCETNFLAVKDIRNMPDYDPTFITGIPDVLQIVANLDFQNLRFVRSASSRLSDSLYQKLKTKFDVPVIEAFGMTEALSHCFTNPLDGEQRIGTVGLPDGVEAKIIQGHLHIKGPTLFTDQWFDTGDLAEQDTAGYYRILGRSRDQINIRGVKVNPVSLENQLLANLEGMQECVIFGEQTINCVYVGNCSPEDVRGFLTDLAPWCRPTMISSVDTIPLNDSGKISRHFLTLYLQ